MAEVKLSFSEKKSPHKSNSFRRESFSKLPGVGHYLWVLRVHIVKSYVIGLHTIGLLIIGLHIIGLHIFFGLHIIRVDIFDCTFFYFK